ncbi:hypothetical protein QFC20_005379 [Naganishia adeliensis]|uniref:Uncharacterized protein n=1 Tax=Naganishia adeliensis TaxID=92952 RepID=A0ACC2VPR6_9TREE|nr:hypothetical protein QFC20_005379 [Naganishia adeliensis]
MTQRLTIQAFPTPIRIATLLLSSRGKVGGASLHPLAHNLLARLIAFAPLHSPEFFAIISNDVEVGVYAAAEMVQRAMVDMRGWALQEYEGGWIEVVDEEWRVLQVDGEQVGQNWEQDGHSSIHPVTASLADAGIHCKYQSSYYADFILVKDEHFAETVALVRNCGCKISKDIPHHTVTDTNTLRQG